MVNRHAIWRHHPSHVQHGEAVCFVGHTVKRNASIPSRVKAPGYVALARSAPVAGPAKQARVRVIVKRVLQALRRKAFADACRLWIGGRGHSAFAS